MDGQILINQPISQLFYQITGVSWAVEDNKLTVFVSLFLNDTDAQPIVQRVYYIPLDGNAAFAGMAESINTLLSQQITAEGLFQVEAVKP